MEQYALITGATKNAGRAIAERFLRAEWRVIVTSRDQARAAEAARELCNAFGPGRALGVAMDPADPASIRQAFAQGDGACGGVLQAFVGNAAHLGMGMNLFHTTPAQWDEVMFANVRGSFFACQEAVRRMGPGGAICLVSSVHAHACLPDRVVYATSKGAINAFVRAAAVELGHRQIRINALIAGSIWTDRWQGKPQGEIDALRACYPLGRESAPEDIANAVYFLCSDQSATMTGSEMTVDSGFLSALGAFDPQWRPQGGKEENP